MIPIIPDFVHEFAYLPHLRLNPLQRLHLEQYLTGLMVLGDHTIAGDPEPEGQAFSVVEIILEEYPWDEKMMEDERGRLIQEKTRKNRMESGVLVLEPALARPAAAEPGLLPGAESARGEKPSLALSHFVCEAFHVPLDFMTFRKTGKTAAADTEEKISALKSLFTQGLKRDLPLSLVWMDEWFFCPETVEFLEKHGHFPYIAAVDGNYQVVLTNRSRTLFEYAESLPREAYKLELLVTGPRNRLVYRYVSRMVELAPVGLVRLVIAYDLTGQKGPLFLATNQRHWDIERILWKYNQPRFVEHLWRDSLFDVARGGLESALGMEWQVRMSFLAETLFQLNAAPLFRDGWAPPAENKTASAKAPKGSSPLFQK